MKILQYKRISNLFFFDNITIILDSIITCDLDQEERSRAVDAYRQGVKDVLVATDVASKGLDFTNIQHVINYDMPDDIENYGNHATSSVIH